MATTIEKQISRMDLPSRENAVVSELTLVLNHHTNETPTKLALLASIASGATIGQWEWRDQKLAQVHVRGPKAQQQRADAEGGSWSSNEVVRPNRYKSPRRLC